MLSNLIHICIYLMDRTESSKFWRAIHLTEPKINVAWFLTFNRVSDTDFTWGSKSHASCFDVTWFLPFVLIIQPHLNTLMHSFTLATMLFGLDTLFVQFDVL